MNRKEQIAQLEQQVSQLRAQEDVERKRAWKIAIDALTGGMSYEEMCGLREVLNERIRDKYASDAIDDE